MECPKCGLEIDDNAMVCPNCKKVLKVICPICKAVNEGNICKKCGYVLVTKCNNCGKVNPTANKLCAKCKFPLEKSVILNEANSDDFVMLTLDFPNLSDIKDVLGSSKSFTKFKQRLDKIITDYLKPLGLRRQIIDKTYVIRFLKDYTFNGCVNSAVNSTVEILNLLTRMNCKLTKRKNISVRCNMFMLKKSVNDDPNDYKCDFNINMIYQKGKNEQQVLNSFQVITDSALFEVLEKNYKLNQLNSVMVDGVMKMYYELDVKDLIEIDPTLFEDEDDDNIQVPNFVQKLLLEQDKIDGEALIKAERPIDPDAIYDMKSIDFSDVSCSFIRTENIDVFNYIIDRLTAVPLGILSIKTDRLYAPYSLKVINEIEKLKLYNNIISITCYDEMKYSPYAFFRNLVSAIFEYTISQKLFNTNDFSAFASVDPKNMIRDLVTLTEREIKDAIDTRNEYFDLFLTLLKVIPNTLIFVENFEKIDASSFDVLKYLFEAFDQMKISYLISYDKNFSLHKKCHFLVSQSYYEEITLKPTPFDKIIDANKNYYKNILNDFYFNRIAKYSCGSILFLDIAIQYLLESEVYEFTNDGIVMVNPKTIIIPANLDKLMRRRLDLLKDEPQTIRFLASVVLLGSRVDIATIDSLGYENSDEIINKLSDLGYLYFYNNCMYFPNYNLLRDSVLSVMNKTDLQKTASELFEKVFDENMPSPVKSYLYTLLGDEDNAFKEWEKLARVNKSLGDFASYLNCSDEIIKILDSKKTEEDEEFNVEDYKFNLYENISENMYEYIPEKTQNIAENTLKELEKTTDTDKIVLLCSRMISGALASAEYTHALSLTHKVLSLIPNASINPEASNFNPYFLLMTLIHIEILFNMGALEDCIDIGYKILNVLNSSNIEQVKPSHMTVEKYKDMIADCVAYIALANVVQLKGNVSDFLNIAYSTLDFIPKSYDIFIGLEQLLLGQEVTYNKAGDDNFSKVISQIIAAFMNKESFAEDIHQAKLTAQRYHLNEIEIFCDLLIAFSYENINLPQKAISILYNIIKSSKDKGMYLVEHLGWYFLSEGNIREHRFDVAYGMLNNSLIQLEKYGKTSDYILMLFRYNMFKVFMYRGIADKAQICLNQAVYISQKYGIKFEFDIDPEHYVYETDDLQEPVEEPAVEVTQESEE